MAVDHTEIKYFELSDSNNEYSCRFEVIPNIIDVDKSQISVQLKPERSTQPSAGCWDAADAEFVLEGDGHLSYCANNVQPHPPEQSDWIKGYLGNEDKGRAVKEYPDDGKISCDPSEISTPAAAASS